MLLSRGAPLLRNVYHFNRKKQGVLNLKQIRTVWSYRRLPETNKPWLIATELLGGIMWWWVFWNLWHEYHHIVGHFPYPRPIEWSDEDLGIPPD